MPLTFRIVAAAEGCGGLAKDIRPAAPGAPAGAATTLNRLVRFQAAAWLGDDRLGVHPRLPALTRHRAATLAHPSRHSTTDCQPTTSGLVARAEGRDIEPLAPMHAEPAVDRAPSTVVERLRAFGINPHDSLAVIR